MGIRPLRQTFLVSRQLLLKARGLCRAPLGRATVSGMQAGSLWLAHSRAHQLLWRWRTSCRAMSRCRCVA
eukprot:15404223-Alexandrium_andersonii.AAC.1